MDKVINMNELIGAAAGDQQHMLGKFLYFSLANLLVDKDELSHLCESLGIPYSGSNRLSVSDAFRSATGDIRERIPVTENSETNIYLAYCRDNKHTPGSLPRTDKGNAESTDESIRKVGKYQLRQGRRHFPQRQYGLRFCGGCACVLPACRRTF